MRSRRRNLWEELELGLGGGSKFRIILNLALHPKKTYTKYAIAKATGLRTPSVENQLETLLRLGWIKEHSFTPKSYEVDSDNEVATEMINLFQRMKGINR